MTSATERLVRIVPTLAKLIITASAVFWIGFVLLDGTGHVLEGDKVLMTLAAMTGFIVPLSFITACAWVWPRIGGAVALAGGLFAGWYLNNPAPQLMMALPLVVGGGLLLLTTRGRPLAQRA